VRPGLLYGSSLMVHGGLTVQDSADRGLDNTVAGTQGALQASDHKYRLLFENMTSGFALHEMVHDAEGRAVDYRFLEVNPAFERLTGIPADRVLGRTVMEVMPQAERYWIDLYDGVVRGGMPVTYENYARALGRYFETISFRAAPGRFAVVFSDVTDRRRAEEALRASERDFRLLAENSTDLVARHAPDSTYLYVSPSCRTMLGYEPEDLIGRPALAFVHPDDLANIEQSRLGVLADPAPDVVTFRMRRKDGTYIWLETSSHTMMEPGSVGKAEIHTSARDISARREAELTLRQLAQERAREASASEALAEAGAALATALDPSRLHEIILDQMARVIPCTTVHIF
jgi:PAS domain S-box-containing protein